MPRLHPTQNISPALLPSISSQCYLQYICNDKIKIFWYLSKVITLPSLPKPLTLYSIVFDVGFHIVMKRKFNDFICSKLGLRAVFYISFPNAPFLHLVRNTHTFLLFHNCTHFLLVTHFSNQISNGFSNRGIIWLFSLPNNCKKRTEHKKITIINNKISRGPFFYL